MLSIPFLKTFEKTKSPTTGDPVSLDLEEVVRQAGSFLKENDPSRALGLAAPWIHDENAPDEVRLIAGRALTALGRFPEALEQFDEYLSTRPECVIGLLSAGLAAARACELARAMDWFNRAARSLTGRARAMVCPLLDTDKFDAIAIEEILVEVESHPEDRDRALALACALGCAGHFRAVERFLPDIDQDY